MNDELTTATAIQSPKMKRVRGLSRKTDATLKWVEHGYPQLADWRLLALEWLKGDPRGVEGMLKGLAAFFELYLVPHGLPLVPAVFLECNTVLPSFYRTACPDSKSGIEYNNKIHGFLDFVLRHKFSAPDKSGRSVTLPDFHNPVPLLRYRTGPRTKTSALQAPIVKGGKGAGRTMDTSLSWMNHEYPQLADWRVLAVEWLKGETNGVGLRLGALSYFFERYIVLQKLPLDPAEFLARKTALPDFFQTTCQDTVAGVRINNDIHAFLNFVLLHEFSDLDDFERPVTSPAFHNPIARIRESNSPRRDESVYSPLPYGYINELRQMLAAGPNFRDWHLAHGGPDARIGKRGPSDADWFEVTEDQIDQDDPDCMTRVREYRDGRQVLQMWSPVRWVSLLIKLILPLRTFQVLMLDSGEADTWRYAAGRWTLNTNQLAQGAGSERRPLQQGVFRRSNHLLDGEEPTSVLYINTNKTADIGKSGTNKGYVVPWTSGGPLHQDPFYWLEKLRNWQEKYNPLSRRTAWTELDGRHISAKSDMQLAGYPNTCFLFRTPEAQSDERHLPATDAMSGTCWFKLLEALEIRLADRGETHHNGAPVRFLPPREERANRLKTLFPLHSLRVSLITALAMDGQVPFPILQKLVGHSRLLMTLYYTKPGAKRIRDVLVGAAERLEANKEASIQNFLLDTEHDELLQKAICNSVPSLAAVIQKHPGARNQAGWMPMHHGLCLVGGNISESDGNGAVGGCFNGGAQIGSNKSIGSFGPVPGGSLNCVRCRWFVTEPHFLPALAAHFNTLAYHVDEARNDAITRDKELQDLKKQKMDAEDADQPFAKQAAFRQSERVWEAAMSRWNSLVEDQVACWRLIERCKAALEAPPSDGTQLVAAGTLSDVTIAFEETNSELLQLAGVCENVEVYPDLEPGKAVFRRSQLLDNVLYNDDLRPVFMLLNEKEQLLVGNAFMRRLAQQMNPENPALGRNEVIRLMDSGVSLSEYFDIDLSSLLPSVNAVHVLPVGRRTLKGDIA